MKPEHQTPLERYLCILETIAASQQALNLTDLANTLSLPKATVHRLVASLQACGALSTEKTNNRSFLIGKRIHRLLQLSQNPSVVGNYAQIICDQLALTLKETCYIVRLGTDSVHTIARSVPDQGYRLHVLPGHDLPLHAAATAKAILAYQDKKTIACLLKPPFKKYTDQTKSTLKEIVENLNHVKKNGYAICDREIDSGVMAYGCPVFSAKNDVIYSIGITGPTIRLEKLPADFWIDELQKSAAKLAEMLKNLKNTE